MKFLTKFTLFICLFISTAAIAGQLNITTANTPPVVLDRKIHKGDKLYLSVKVNPGIKQFNIEEPLKEDLINSGLQIVNAPNLANYWILVSVERVTQLDADQLTALKTSRYGYSTDAGTAFGRKPKDANTPLQAVVIADVEVAERRGEPATTPSDDTSITTNDTIDLTRYYTRVLSIASESDFSEAELKSYLANSTARGITTAFLGKR